jgi:hypothetical protein
MLPNLTGAALNSSSLTVVCVTAIALVTGDTRSVQWRICRAPVGSLHLCSARAQEGARGWMPLCSCPSRASQRLHVGTNDIADPADLGVTVDFVDVSLLLAKTIL